MSKSFFDLFAEADMWRQMNVKNEPKTMGYLPPAQKFQKFIIRIRTPDGQIINRTVIAANRQEAEQMAAEDYQRVKGSQLDNGRPKYRQDIDKSYQNKQVPAPVYNTKEEPVAGTSWWKRAWQRMTGQEAPNDMADITKVDSAHKVDYLLKNRNQGKAKWNDIDPQDMNYILKALLRGRKYDLEQLRRMLDGVKQFYNNKSTRWYFGEDRDARPSERDNGMLVQKLIEKGWLKRTKTGNLAPSHLPPQLS